MSKENVELLQPVYEAWARGDFQVGAEIYDPGVVWVLSDEFPNPGEHRGLRAMREGFRDWLRGWADWRIEAERYIERDEQVVVLTRYHARGRESGALVDRPGAHVWTFHNGRAVRQEVWMDRAEALEAVGLSEQAVSRENVEVMEAGYAAIARGDLDAFLAITHPQIEFRSLIAESEGGNFRGREGVRDWWAAVIESLGIRPGAEKIEAFRDRGITRMRLEGTVAGVDVPQRMWMAWRVRDGLWVWWATFRTEAEALEAVGLSEQALPRVRELARRTEDALNRRDLDALAAIFHPELEFHSAIARSEGGIYLGVDGMRQYFADVDGAWEEFQSSWRTYARPGSASSLSATRSTKPMASCPCDPASRVHHKRPARLCIALHLRLMRFARA